MAGRRVTTSGPVLIHLLYSTWDGVKGMARNFIHQEVREEHNLLFLVPEFLFDTKVALSLIPSYTIYHTIYIDRHDRNCFSVEERLGTSRLSDESSRPVPLVFNLSSTENE